MIADWWQECHGVDPAAHLRGAYSTEEGKAEIVRDAGGILSLVSSLAQEVGAKRTLDPKDGDFAVIHVDGNWFCAIRSGQYWSVRSHDGVAFINSAKVVRAWEI